MKITKERQEVRRKQRLIKTAIHDAINEVCEKEHITIIEIISALADVQKEFTDLQLMKLWKENDEAKERQSLERELVNDSLDILNKSAIDVFQNIQKVHDWRNYVPDELIEGWDILTDTEKSIIHSFAVKRAGSEIWD